MTNRYQTQQDGLVGDRALVDQTDRDDRTNGRDTNEQERPAPPERGLPKWLRKVLAGAAAVALAFGAIVFGGSVIGGGDDAVVGQEISAEVSESSGSESGQGGVEVTEAGEVGGVDVTDAGDVGGGGEGAEAGEVGDGGGTEAGEVGVGGEAGHSESGSSETGESGVAAGTGEPGESGTQYAINQTFDEVQSGARLILGYNAQTNAFNGTVENTTNSVLNSVRVEVHLSNGVELGPTTSMNLAPGQVIDITLPATTASFTTFSAHPEVG